MITENVLPKFLDDILAGTTEISKKELYLLKWDLKEAQSQNQYLEKVNNDLRAELEKLQTLKEKQLDKNDARLDNCLHALLAIKRSLDENDETSYSIYKGTEFNIRKGEY